VPVDAYCVEHGRWTTNREGVATGGKFGVAGLLADTKVRTAAQYKRDQGEVWAKVAAVNAANRKEAASGTLMASVDSADIAARRAALSRKVEDFLDGARPADDVVGLAYAVDGKVRAVRWFANRGVFRMFRAALVQTAAMEAITAQSEAAARGTPLGPAPAPSASTVSEFVKDIQEGALKEQRATRALNANEFREGKAGYGATTIFNGSSASGAPAKPRPVSTSATSF
jgi:hypothetical protein